VHVIVVAGTHSGVGKTSVTLGLIAALRRRGLVVQSFKVGPDFIDPSHHERAARRPSYNLDGWMLSREANLDQFATHSAGADVAIVEGMMGLFDGADPADDGGSAAEMAGWLGAAVLLVIDASAMARSAAALVHGYASFEPSLRLAGVVANRVGSVGHAGLIAEALEGQAALLGWLPGDPALSIPERHLGLHMPEHGSAGTVDRLADAVERGFDIDALLTATELDRPGRGAPAPQSRTPRRARLGVARDDAFSFYYRDNLELLSAAGAELVEFSPLGDELPEDLDGIYFGGGYPELHAAALARNRPMREAVRAMAEGGRPIYGECGGLIYLGEALVVDGVRHEMCGALPVSIEFPGTLELGYCQVETSECSIFGGGRSARGHWFHKGRVAAERDSDRPYTVERRGHDAHPEGYLRGGVQASWVHLHFRSCPSLANALVGRAAVRATGGA
jgi:cobyrinic acid a,c-diamide synthase